MAERVLVRDLTNDEGRKLAHAAPGVVEPDRVEHDSTQVVTQGFGSSA
jgi:hypothetical protein